MAISKAAFENGSQFDLFNYEKPIETQSLFRGGPGQGGSNNQYMTELKHTTIQYNNMIQPKKKHLNSSVTESTIRMCNSFSGTNIAR